MVKEYFRNPVCISVLALVFIFYSGIFIIPDVFTFNSLIDKRQVQQISGYIISSPAKSSSGKNYAAKFKVHNVENQGIKASANGVFTILIPSTLVEMHFPGKLYTKANSEKGFIYESGGKYTFTGQFNDEYFKVDSCKECVFDSSVFGKIDEFRAKCRLQFKRLMYLWKDGGGLLLALLCGAREYTNPEVADAFKKAGLSHILALSGMHLSMFSAIALFLGNRIGRKKLTFVIRVIALICFLWFAGFSPSLTRAFICSMLLILASMAAVEQPDMIIILCFTFLLQCVMYPGDIKNYGFMLSYAALLGILLTNQFFSKIYDRFLPRILSSSLASSSGAQILTVPISLKLFGAYSPIGVIATSVVSPIITIFIYSGLLLIIVCLIFPSLAFYSGILLNFEYTIIKYLVGIFSLAPRITI